LNSGQNSDLRTYYVGVRSSSKPNLVFAKPLFPCGAVRRSSFIANLSNVYCRGGGLCSWRSLPRGGDNLGTQPHLALQQLCFEPLHQLFVDLILLGLKAHEAQVELAFFLFGRVGKGLHNSVDHLTHVLGHHYGPLGLFYRRSLGCDSRSRLALHQLVDHKVANDCERRNVFDGRLHLG
jgi:hypothetical protein